MIFIVILFLILLPVLYLPQLPDVPAQRRVNNRTVYTCCPEITAALVFRFVVLVVCRSAAGPVFGIRAAAVAAVAAVFGVRAV